MVVVVESLTNSTESNKEILSRVDVLIVWLVAIEMCPAVDKPGYIQSDDVTEDGADEERIPSTFTPEVPRYKCWEDETHEDH